MSVSTLPTPNVTAAHEPQIQARRQQALAKASVDIKNVVASFQIGMQLDLQVLSGLMRNSVFKRRQNAMAVHMIEPRATIMVYRTGRCMVLGAKSAASAEAAAKRCTLAISKALSRAMPRQKQKVDRSALQCNNFAVHNVVGLLKLPFLINLEAMYNENMLLCQYDMEAFPGLVLRLPSPDVTLLVFHSGKVVLTKGKCAQDLQRAAHDSVPLLQKFKTCV
eukprot:m.30764 g.30764  ORF g.30764 m.30764 type:complete len:221 (+) comp9328_c2_seq1:318-980(+)